MRSRSLLLAWVSCLALLGALGCGKKGDGEPGAEHSPEAVELKMLVLGYRAALDAEATPPTKPEDLLKVIHPNRPIDFSRYVIIWGVNPAEVADPGKTVLAYEAGVPKGGGLVGFVDGSVRRVTAEEFRELPRAVPSSRVADRPAAYSLSPKEYADGFRRASPRPPEKYRRKVIELKGVVLGFTTGFDKEHIVRLGSAPGGRDGVECKMVQDRPWARYSKGQQLTVKGIGPPEGEWEYPHLKHCVVVKAGPPTGLTATAEKLAQDYDSGPDGFEKKNQGKSVVVTGEVVRREDTGPVLRLYLKGTTKRTVACEFGLGRATKKRAQRLAPGTKVKLYGELARSDSPGTIALSECELITD